MNTEASAHGDPLRDPDELLYRIVHPSFVHDGRITSQAFRPTPKDEDRLSVDRSSLSTPSESFERFQMRGFPAEGVAAVSVAECLSIDLTVCSDPIAASADEPGNPAHALIDFGSLESSKARERAGKRLAAHARARGWLFRAGNRRDDAPSLSCG